MRFRVAVPAAAALEAANPLGSRLYALPGEATGVRGGSSSVRRMLTCPASGGEDGRSRAGCPDPAGIPGAGSGRARTGAVCARDGPRPGIAGSGLPG
jgi:hypothetical protein